MCCNWTRLLEPDVKSFLQITPSLAHCLTVISSVYTPVGVAWLHSFLDCTEGSACVWGPGKKHFCEAPNWYVGHE